MIDNKDAPNYDKVYKDRWLKNFQGEILKKKEIIENQVVFPLNTNLEAR